MAQLNRPARRMPRRNFLGLLGAGAVGTVSGSWATQHWLGGALGRPARAADPNEIAVPPVSITTRSGIRIHGIQTGFVAIKTAHARLKGFAPLRLLSIIQDTQWTELLPILAWVIEHPEGLFVVDTGEVAAATDIDTYLANDPPNRWFFKRNLPLFVTPAEELAAQMRGLGLEPEAVRTVIMTHLHGDHAGGLGFFPNAEFLIARDEYTGHQRQPMGAVSSLWPAGFAPTLIDYTGPALNPFPASFPVTNAGDLSVVPTPGHSYGHQSVILRDGEQSYFFAGDLAFSSAQLREQGLQGIAQDLDKARDALTRTLAFTRQTPTIFLPTHDPQSLTRLRTGMHE
jgi:glyoxylase-like metal-dependent hydrolase (beta-lactamase superfamily II)